MFFLASINNNIIMEELRKTSVADLIRTWIDLMRANTQHAVDKNCRKRKAVEEKTQKYLTKLSQGMGTIQQDILHAHHAVCKLDNLTNDGDNDSVAL